MVGSELCRATRAAWRWARLRASTGADHAADVGPMSTAAASAKDVTALLHGPVAARAWFFLGLAVQRKKIPLRRGRNYCHALE